MNNVGDRSFTFILVPGHWLGAWAWEDVARRLEEQGHRAVPLTLPGTDPDDVGRASRTLDDQADAIVAALRAARARAELPVVVGHSGANAPISAALDLDPGLAVHVVWVDSGPVGDGWIAAPQVDPNDELPLPAFEDLAHQASLDGLDRNTLARFRCRAVPEPGPVVAAPVRLRDDARLDIPTTMVCCSYSSDQIKEMAAAGHPMMAEVAQLSDVSFVDLPTGHWPMWSRPVDLAEVVAQSPVIGA